MNTFSFSSAVGDILLFCRRLTDFVDFLFVAVDLLIP